MLGFTFTLQSLPPVLTLIIEDMEFTHTEAGSLMSFFALPTIFLSILAGLLSDRWGPFKVGVISLILLITGTVIFAIGNTFIYIGLGRIISGIGAATIAIVAAQIISQWFRGREIGTAMGIYNTAVPVGTIICYTTFGNLGQSLGWRMPIFITSTIGVIGLASFITLYKPAPNLLQKTTLEKQNKIRGLFSSLLNVGVSMWLIGMCWMWFNAAAISYSTFGPDFFISKGYSIGFSGFLVSILVWGSLFLSPIIGRFVDKVNNHEIFIGTGGLILAAAIYLITRTTDYLFLMIVMSVAVAFIPAPVFSFPSKILRPENLGLVFGILFTFSSLGMFFGPSAAGLVRDKTGSYEATFIFLSILALFVPLTALILRIKIIRESP
jgi:predicted MFS family arabinose efflux permease